MDQWLPLQDYPGYSASDLGRVRNDKRDHVLAIVRSSRRPYVCLVKNGVQVKRGLSLLIAETFVQTERKEYFNTAIHLDGDLSNCRARNLMWRPRWFALKHTHQFSEPWGDSDPVINTVTNTVHKDVWSVVFEHGVLYSDVLQSIYNKTYVFPLMQTFEWL
jgi:hypothetical protein